MNQIISAIIVDDETQSRVVIRSLLGRFSTEVQIVGEAEDVETALSLIKAKQPQLVFLDIQMPKGDGFHLLKQFDRIPFEVIFVTSYDKYAINAIKFSALDYLLKPIEVNDLKEAVSKALKTISRKQSTNIQVVNLLRNLESEDSITHKIAVQAGEQVKLINTATIVYIESDGSYCNIYTQENDRFVTSKYLKDFEDYFGPESGFVRIHRGILINVQQIKSYNKGEPCVIEMCNGKNFEVARRKKHEVLEKLKR
ncbi:MAG: two component transcriptional regulator, LytTR family [Bacteroidetes bacterium]|jgi:two-component system LytT family response regulator|nr:two component transcriptional regulator, LytTR family [Bacteroidota bacterium]